MSLLGRKLDAEGMRDMEDFGMKYLRADLKEWFYSCWLTVQCVPLFKTVLKDTVRPLGLRNPLAKTLHKEVALGNRVATRERVEPLQTALTKGGGSIMAFSVRGVQELIDFDSEYVDHVICTIDLENAHNAFFRAETLKVLGSEPTLRHLASSTAARLAPHSGLECGGKLWGMSGEGGTQGDPATGDDFAITLQPSLELLDEACKVGGGGALAGADDVVVYGHKDVVPHAVDDFAREIEERCGLRVQWRKTKLYSKSSALPDGCPEGVKRAGREIDGEFVRGFTCWGVPMGEDRYVKEELKEKVDKILSDGRQGLELLGSEHRHAAWHALKQSVWPRFDYFAQNCYPSLTIPVAARLDHGLHSLLELVVGFPVPLERSPDSVMLSTNIPGWEGIPFAAWALRQPIKCGGMGLRRYVDICRPAFLGACELALPRLHKGFCPILTSQVGGADSHGEEWQGRWTTLLSSGCRAGKELAESWRLLQLETRSAMTFLEEDDEEVEGPLSAAVEDAGEGSVTGGTRGQLVQDKEMLMGRVMLRALEKHPRQGDRAVFSWPQRDKLSAAFLLQLPGHDSSLTAAEFGECVAALLCLPSPACSDPRVLGANVGKRKVDRFGDNAMAEAVKGDNWRKRHNAVERKLFSLLKWAGVESELEVFNEFSGLIPQEGLNRMERGRKRQGLVPDFRLRIAGVEGPGRELVLLLAELKLISCCVTWYKRDPRPKEKAVDARAALLPGDYRGKARKVDTKFGGVPAGEEGPVARRLASYPRLQGWVFGAWNEASQDVHNLVPALAKARLKHEQGLEGRGGKRSIMAEAGAIAILTGQIRRGLSLVVARENARVLLARVQGLGRGAAEAAGRRRWAESEEWRMRREQQAHWLGQQLGRSILRRGERYLH